MQQMKDRPDVGEVADRARGLARDINKNVSRILGVLQIGDVSRQRAKHIQSGLELLDGLDGSEGQLKVRATAEMLLAAQLEAALMDHSHEVSKLIPSIEGLASDALALLALSNLATELGQDHEDFRALRRRMDAAVQLVAEIQAADGAVRYLTGRLVNGQGATLNASPAEDLSGRHPLDHKAWELLERVRYMEAAADDCVVILERLKEAAEALCADAPTKGPSAESPFEWRDGLAAAATIQAIREKAGADISAQAGKNSEIFRLLDRDANPAISHEPWGELETGRYAGMKFTVADLSAYDDALKGQLSVILSKIESLYAMSQERDVHRVISQAYGLEVAEEPDESEDGLF
jgi:hypothetical protein